MKIPKPKIPGITTKKEKEEQKEEAIKKEKEQDEKTTNQIIELTPEQTPIIVKDGKGETILTLNTTTEKLLYQIIQQQDIIIQQNQHMIQQTEKE